MGIAYTHDELRMLIAAHALDALDADDATAVREHLVGCTECQASFDEAIEIATAIALTAPVADPPPALRDRILAAAIGERAAPAAIVALRPRRRFVEIVTPSRNLAAAFALAAGLLGVLYLSARQDVRDLEARGDAAAIIAQALSRPGTRVVALSGPGGAGGGAVVLAANRRPLVVAALAPAPPGKVWEVWAIGGDGTPVSAGLLRGGDEVSVELARDVAPGSTVAITIEPDDGAAHQGPTGPIALSGGIS